MKVSEIGEFGLIDQLAEMAYAARDEKQKAWQQLILGIGDDAAAWSGDSSIQLVTVDSLIQGVHFTLDIVSWEDLGWRALAANLSDIAAMGGLPRYALVSLALPGTTEVADVTALYRGMLGLAGQFGVAIAGGNISYAPLVVLDITVLGSNGSRERGILTRSAAKPGDKVAFTGYPGAAAAGLEMLTKDLKFDAEAAISLKRAFQRPYPRVVEGQVLVDQGVKTAIDISDGLIGDLGHICQASQVGARIEVERVPILPEVRKNFGERALELTLSGGEAYELLFTASAEVISKVQAAVTCPVTIIGEITAEQKGKVVLVDARGNTLDLARTGWEHFTTG
ncbi:MAG: thiamine-phosphate kinase [Dehalococcoidales bacterium]|nr:thiamine-phosphate kinase [Dehalococcoidales bacterium]